MDSCLDNLESNLEQIRALNAENITNSVFWWLVFMAASLKHPAFVEEREWRVIYIPSMDRSETVQRSVECIQGIPQVVEKIPLINDMTKGLDRADLDNLLHRVIIGPSEYPLVLFDAFERALSSKNIADAADRISVSFIPLRS